MAWRRGAVVATGVLLLAAGCTESSNELPGSGGASGSGNGGTAGVGGSSGTTSGSGGTAGSGAGGAGGAGGVAPDACDSCLETKCGAQLDACDSNPECIAIDDCLETCQDQACYDQCFAAHPAGQAAFDAIESCDLAQCSVECGGSGGSGGSGGGTADPCELCVDAKCATSLNACLADPDCTAFWDCVDPCQDEACENQCVAQHPSGVVKSDAVDACVEQQCPTECAF